MSRTTFITHRATVVLMGIAVVIATTDGFAQSYAGLRRWAIEHHLSAWKADSFPLLVDLFIAVGELGLFALALEGHRLTRRGLAWADLALPFGIAAAGWSVSLAFNVGSVGHQLADQLTAAVPPVASMLGLLVLLRTLHRLVAEHRPGVEHTVAEARQATDEDEDRAEDTLADLRPKVAEPPVEVAGTLEENVAAAYALGASKRRIARENKISRHKVDEILTELAEVAVEPVQHTVIGHPVPVAP
jgi:hypothetical protein